MTEYADRFKRDPQRVLRMSTLRFLVWMEAVVQYGKEQDARALRIAMAGNQLQFNEDGLQDFRENMTGPQSKEAKELQEKYAELQRRLMGLGF